MRALLRPARAGAAALRVIEPRPGLTERSRLSDKIGDDGLHLYELGGELDIAGAGYVPNRLCEARGPAVVDLPGLTFIDAAGTSALLAARHTIESRGDRVELTWAGRVVRRAFDVIGVADMLDA